MLYAVLAAAAILGFFLGRSTAWKPPLFQNHSEAAVSRELASSFSPPDYHLLNHITLRTDDSTTQIDHILVSRFGIFVIETKEYKGWLFANASDAKWTQVLFQLKFRFQNPLIQNAGHVRAVQDVLAFLPPGAVTSIVVFTGTAEFKTDIPPGVVFLDDLVQQIRTHVEPVMSLKKMRYCVGWLEATRLALSQETDLQHIERLSRRFGRGAV